MGVDLQISLSCESPGWDGAGLYDVVDGVIRAVLDDLDITAETVELSVTLTDDESIRILNRDYRGKDKPTNVLSFAMQEGEGPEDVPGMPLLLGDLVLAHGTIVREAAEQDKAFDDHFRHLLVHGALHLLGYDHEDDAEAEEMEALEIEILSRMGIENPYKNEISMA